MEQHHRDYYSKVQGSFLARTDFDPQTKLILINLIGRSGIKTWTCSPANVSKETGIPLRTVSRRFEVLERMGVLEYVGKEEAWGTRFNKYNINRATLAAVTQTVAGGLETVATDTQTVAAVSRTAISKIKKEEPEVRNKKKDEYKEDKAAVSRPPAISDETCCRFIQDYEKLPPETNDLRPSMLAALMSHYGITKNMLGFILKGIPA